MMRGEPRVVKSLRSQNLKSVHKSSYPWQLDGDICACRVKILRIQGPDVRADERANIEPVLALSAPDARGKAGSP